MTAISDLNTVPDHAAVRRHLRRAVQALMRSLHVITQERRLRRTIRALHALDDRMLADIGTVRGEIEHAVRNGPARRQLLRR